MDPFTQFQNCMQRDLIQGEVYRLLTTQRDAPDRYNAELEALGNRVQGIPQPVREIRAFEFTVPETSLAEVLQTAPYRRAKAVRHYKRENGKDYYNSNQACLVYEDPDRVGMNARIAAEGRNPQPADAELNRIYQHERAAQMNRNRDAEMQEPTWVLCQRSSPNDTHQEDTTIRYTDNQHTEVDWHETITNLHELGRTLGYTLAHYNQAMNRLVSHFKPTLSPLIKGMDANNTARFLMSLNTPKPERQRHFQAIKNMTRPVGMELRAIMGILNQRATGYYATEPEEARANLIDNMMLVGLQNFTSGITSAAIRNTIQQQQLDNIRPDWIRILETAIASEELQGVPQTPMSFSAPTQGPCFTNTTLPLFNSTIGQVNPLVNTAPTGINPLVHGNNCPQQTYQMQQLGQLVPNQTYNPYGTQHPAVPWGLAPNGNPYMINIPPQQAQQAAPPPVPAPLAPMRPPPAPPQPQPQQATGQQAEADGYAENPFAELAFQTAHSTPIKDAEMLDLMQQAKLQDKEMSPEEFQQRASERVKAAIQKKLDLEAKATSAPQIANHMILAKQNSEIMQGLSKLIETLSVNSAAPPSNSHPAPNARPIMPDRPRTPGRQDRDRSPSPYRGNRDGNRGRDAYRRDGDNRDRFRSQSADNRYRNRTPQRNDRYRSPAPGRDSRDGNRPPPSQYRDRTPNRYDDRAQSRDYNYRPQSPSPVDRRFNPMYRNQSPARTPRPDTPRNGYRSDQRSTERPRTPEKRSDNRDRYNRTPSPSKGQNGDQPILRGINCQPNYNRSQGLMCTKCSTFGKHAEYACPTYFNWAAKACYICRNGFHQGSDCVENRNRQRTPERSTTPNRKN